MIFIPVSYVWLIVNSCCRYAKLELVVFHPLGEEIISVLVLKIGSYFLLINGAK